MNLQPSSRRISVFLLGTLVLIGVSVFIWLWVREFRGDRDFRVVLLQVDLALEDQNLQRAQDLLETLLPRVTTPGDGLRLIKRGYQLFDETGDGLLLGRVTLALLEKYPGNEDIRGYRTNYLIEVQNLNEAGRIAGGLSSSTWLPYKIEAYLKARIPLDSDLINLRLPGVALPLTPEDYSKPNSFLQAWAITSDLRYLKNGVLLLAAEGNIDSAFELLDSQRTKLLTPDELLLFSVLSFDSKGGEEGISYLSALENEFSSRKDLYRLLAEFLFAAGELESASGALMPILGTSDALAQDYINGSRFFRSQGNWGEAEMILLDGLSMFPDDPVLVYSFLSLLRDQGDQEAFDEYFARSLGESPSDPWLILTSILLEAEERGYNEVVPQLWQLTQDAPEFDRGWRNLLWVLWMIDDRDGFNEALKRVDPAIFPWIRQFEALKFIREDQLVEALQVGAMLPSGGSYSMYSVPGLRAGLQSFESPEAQELFEQGLSIGVEYIETPDLVREYLMYLGSWLGLLQGTPEISSQWYSRLTQNFPRSVYSTRLRYWTSSER